MLVYQRVYMAQKYTEIQFRFVGCTSSYNQRVWKRLDEEIAVQPIRGTNGRKLGYLNGPEWLIVNPFLILSTHISGTMVYRQIRY